MSKILVTSALPYVNNVPHIGNLIGCVLSADVFARYARMRYGRENVLYICGADEHGTATETKAKQEGLTPQELCDKYYAIHKEIYDWFAIDFDIFGRTSTEDHHQLTQELFKQVVANGYVEEKTVVQPYSEKSQMFLADRFIEGICPHCDYDSARGDQCDNCGKLLNPQELIKPVSTIDGTQPEFRETDHLFLRLDKLQPALETWVGRAEGWTENTIRTTMAWFKEGLRSRAITRDLKWGIPIPDDLFEGRFKDKVFYVWFDAPIGYISITKQLLGDSYKDWWQGDTKLVQFMGKDNIPFHSIIFPGTLLATNPKLDAKDPQTNWTLVDIVSATEYLNYEGGKFSKSRNVGVFGDDVQQSGIPADVWRYTLLFYRPETSDSQFSWEGLQNRLNNELVANLGNFVHRTLTFTQRFFEGRIEKIASLTEEQQLFVENWKTRKDTFINTLEGVHLRESLMQLMSMSSMCNNYFQTAQPWKTREEDPARAQADMALLNMMVKDLAIIMEPYLPATSQKIFKMLNLKNKGLSDFGQPLPAGHSIGEPEVLFTKLEDERVEELKAEYSGDRGPKDTDVDLRVGRIIEVRQHPNADKLFIEQVDLGGETVQIVSGLIGHYTAEELLGKQVVIVKNLKAAKLRGEKSEGMVLAAEHDGTVGLILAPNAKPGERVRSEKQGSAKPELTFEEFMKFEFQAKDGEVLLNGRKLAAKESNLVIDKSITDGDVR